MTLSIIKFNISYNPSTVSYYSLLEKLKNELKKAYYNCETDDEIDSDDDSDDSDDIKDVSISDDDKDYEYNEIEIVKHK